MDYTKVRAVLDKYWRGETSVEEEIYLKELFKNANDCPPELRQEKELFQYFRFEENLPALNEDLTGRLREIWRNEPASPAAKKVFVWPALLKYAAVILPLFVAGYLALQKSPPTEQAVGVNDTYTNSKQAIAETERVLMLMSRNMNDGLAKTATLRMFGAIEKNSKVRKPK